MGASFTDDGAGVATYKFSSLTLTGGLIKYCVYPTTGTPPATTLPDTIDAVAVGANGQAWIESKAKNNFSFSRPNGSKGGDPSNIPLVQQTITMGSATWNSGTVPADQTILLHVIDATICPSTVTSCFVRPGLPTGPICNAAEPDLTKVAYTDIPVDVVNCGPPSFGYEAHFTREFGSEVQLSKVGDLSSMTAEFDSYGCNVSGHWNADNGLCVTDATGTTATPGTTFTVPMIAKVYAVGAGGTPGTLLATSDTVSAVIPYRPSADATNCKDGQGNPTGAWFNTVSQQCEFSAKVVITFPFSTGTTFAANQHVIWTVSFNTTHAGNPAIGEATPCFEAVAADPTAPGCGYDSLNLGTMTYPNAPYAGVNTNPENWVYNTNSGGATYSWVRVDGGEAAGYAPLGEITLK